MQRGKRIRGGVIQRRSRETTERGFAAKVLGLLALHSHLLRHDLDFLVLCSSIGSVLHNLKFGEVSYVAGADFFNAYAHAFCRMRPGRAIAIHWTDWEDAGMWAEAQIRLREKYAAPASGSGASADAFQLLHGLAEHEGIEAFSRILADPDPAVVVSRRISPSCWNAMIRFRPRRTGPTWKN